MSKTSQSDPPDVDLEEVLRTLERDELYENLCKEIAVVQWQIIEETDRKTGLKSHVLLGDNDLPMWRIPHADKGVAALVVDALLVGATLGEDVVKEQSKGLLEKLQRWQPPIGKFD